MNVEELTALLGGWEGDVLGTVGRVEPDEEQGRFKPEIWLELRPLAERRKCCSECGQAVDQVHDFEERWVRELPILGPAGLVRPNPSTCPTRPPRRPPGIRLASGTASAPKRHAAAPTAPPALPVATRPTPLRSAVSHLHPIASPSSRLLRVKETFHSNPDLGVLTQGDSREPVSIH